MRCSVPPTSASRSKSDRGPVSRNGRIERLRRCESIRIGRPDRHRTARVITVHGPGRNQDRRVDADRIHRRHRVVARHLRRTGENIGPRPSRAILFINMDLRIDGQIESLRNPALIRSPFATRVQWLADDLNRLVFFVAACESKRIESPADRRHVQQVSREAPGGFSGKPESTADDGTDRRLGSAHIKGPQNQADTRRVLAYSSLRYFRIELIRFDAKPPSSRLGRFRYRQHC